MPSLRSSSQQQQIEERRTTRASASANAILEEENEDQEEPVEDELLDQEDEEDEEEEEAETRCICGLADPPDEGGLFIQCEKCQVWQHGYCVSISEIVPEKYWCEQCKPELHSIIISPDGKLSRYILVQPKESSSTSQSLGSKRKNKRVASGSQNKERESTKENLDEDERSAKRRKERATFNSREDARYEALIQRVMEESKKDAHLDNEDDKSQGTTRSSRSSRRRRHDDGDEDTSIGQSDDGNVKHEGEEDVAKGDNDVDMDNRKEELDDNGDDQKKNGKTKPRNGDRSKNIGNRSKTPESESNESTSTSNRTKSSSRPSTNSRSKKPINPSPAKSKKDTSIDFNKPTKPRLPQPRTTLNEMRKRVGAILEFIGRTQIDIANEQSEKNELTKFIEDESSKGKVEKLFENYNGSLELMDGLTRKLLVWEQKYGKYGDK